jgi:hypothetical protein
MTIEKRISAKVRNSFQRGDQESAQLEILETAERFGVKVPLL